MIGCLETLRMPDGLYIDGEFVRPASGARDEIINPATFPEFNTNCGANSSGNPGCTVTTCSCTATSYYWSSSTYAGNPVYAWLVGIGGGDVLAGDKSSVSLYVRAVRGGS